MTMCSRVEIKVFEPAGYAKRSIGVLLDERSAQHRIPAAMAYWLLKTEPTTFSIDDLARKETEHWDGVRNFQARNHLRAMKVGELGFFYHSSVDPKGIAGICEVVREAYPDDSQFDPESKYYDPNSSREDPRWWMPDVRFVKKFDRLITLDELRQVPGLEEMVLLRRSRLSVQPVGDKEWEIITHIAEGS